MPGESSYLFSLLQSLLALLGVCVLAWVILRAGARRGFGVGPAGKTIRVLERVPLDARRALYVVRAGDRTLLLAASDAGGVQLLSEMTAVANEPVAEVKA